MKQLKVGTLIVGLACAALTGCSSDVPAPMPEKGQEVANRGPHWPDTGAKLVVHDTGRTHVRLSWPSAIDDDGEIAGFRLTVNGVEQRLVGGTSTLVSGLAAATSYSFVVRAVDDAGELTAPLRATAQTEASCATRMPVRPRLVGQP